MTPAEPAAKSATVKPEKSGQRRAFILRRAAEIFDAKGYSNTSLEDIAAAVGFKREALYYYFRSKGEILCEIIRPESEYLTRGMARIRALTGVSVQQKIAMAVENHMSRINPNYLEMAVALRELTSQDLDPQLSSVRQIWREYQDDWISLVEEGLTNGELDARLDARFTAFAILGMCNSPSSWFRTGGNRPLSDLSETFVRIVLFGTSARADAS